MATQKEIAAHLDMSERNCRDMLKGLGIDWTQATLDDVRVAYIRDLREKAAGRGGSQAELLAIARTQESTVKAANGRLTYHEKLGTLVPTADAAFALNDWASFGNREYLAGFEKLTQELEATLKVSIDRGMVERIAGSTVKRIGGYAAKLGQRIAGSSHALQSAPPDTDS